MSIFKQKQVAYDPLVEIVEEIIKTSGFNDLPLGDRNYFKEHLTLQLNRRLGLIIAENLKEDGLEEYNKLLSDGLIPDPSKLQNILEKNLPDYQEKIKLGLDEFVKQILVTLTK